MIGQTLSQFEIADKPGEGGMGEVYRATDAKLGREVAIKVLPEAFVADEERLARFKREAQVLAALNHPSIAGIHQVDEADGVHFLVMELAGGRTSPSGSPEAPCRSRHLWRSPIRSPMPSKSPMRRGLSIAI